MSETMNMGQRFYHRRLACGMTLRDVRDKTGIAISYVSRLERHGDWRGISIYQVTRLAAAVGWCPADVLGWEYLTGNLWREPASSPHSEDTAAGR